MPLSERINDTNAAPWVIEEIKALEAKLEACNDYAESRAAVLDLVRQALGVPEEPHQGMDERVLEAIDALAAHLEALVAWADAYVGTIGLYEEVESARNANTTSLARHDADVIAALRFPTMLRKMWSGGDVQRWIDEQAEEKRQQAKEGGA